MKRLLLIIALFLFCLVPTLAQDATSEPTVEAMPVEIVSTPAPVENSGNDTVINVGTPATQDNATEENVSSILIGIVMLAVLFFGGIALYFVSQLVPGGVAKELFDAGVKAGYQMAMNRAELTQTQLDDQVYSALANIQGLDVTKDADGHYVVKPRTPVSVSSTGGTFDSSAPRMP